MIAYALLRFIFLWVSYIFHQCDKKQGETIGGVSDMWVYFQDGEEQREKQASKIVESELKMANEELVKVKQSIFSLFPREDPGTERQCYIFYWLVCI